MIPKGWQVWQATNQLVFLGCQLSSQKLAGQICNFDIHMEEGLIEHCSIDQNWSTWKLFKKCAMIFVHPKMPPFCPFDLWCLGCFSWDMDHRPATLKTTPAVGNSTLRRALAARWSVWGSMAVPCVPWIWKAKFGWISYDNCRGIYPGNLSIRQPFKFR